MNQTLAAPTAARTAEPLPFAIRVLRRLNPLIAGLLRSPLHRLVSRDLLLLTYTGSKTGRRRTLPLSYVTRGHRLYLCTRSSVWARSLRDGKPVDLLLRGRRMPATPVVLDVRTPEALDALRTFLTANPKTAELLYQVAAPGGRPDESDLRREVLRSVVVRLDT
jgi:hypothetical protein